MPLYCILLKEKLIEGIEAKRNICKKMILKKGNKEKKRKITKRRIGTLAITALVVVLATALCCCGNSSGGDSNNGSGIEIANPPNWDKYASASLMDGYEGLKDYEGELRYREFTSQDLLAEMDNGSTFAIFFAFPDCPWCNHVVGPLNDVAAEEGIDIAYLNTRRDPSWKSNKDIDLYDEITARFDEFIPRDDDGSPHIYVPVVYFVKAGKAISAYEGTVPSQKDSEDELTKTQLKELKAALKAEIEKLA